MHGGLCVYASSRCESNLIVTTYLKYSRFRPSSPVHEMPSAIIHLIIVAILTDNPCLPQFM